MKKLLTLLVLCACAYAAALLANPSRADYMSALQNASTRSIWVSSNGWHTGIIVQTADIPPPLLREKAPFMGERFVEMGWGDAGFYQAEEITTQLAAKALLVPSPSAVHLVGFSAEPSQYFTASEVLHLRVSEAGFARLLEFMDNSISRAPSAAIKRSEGLYGNSRFVAGSGHYSAVRTCNHWAADALQAAGVPLTPWYAATSSALMWQLRRYAE